MNLEKGKSSKILLKRYSLVKCSPKYLAFLEHITSWWLQLLLYMHRKHLVFIPVVSLVGNLKIHWMIHLAFDSYQSTTEVNYKQKCDQDLYIDELVQKSLKQKLSTCQGNQTLYLFWLGATTTLLEVRHEFALFMI